MPEISRFFGIVIRMFMEAGVGHHTPHFHAYYQGRVGVFSIDPVDLIAGELPRVQRRLAEAWAELHQEGAEGRLGAAPSRSTTRANRSATMNT